MKTHEIGFGNSYPHYYTIKGTNGIGKITGVYLKEIPVEIGDTIIISKVEHKVIELETSTPKSKRHPKGAVAYSATTEYNPAQTNN